MGGGIGTNINGPSLIRVPNWIEKPLGRYYLYFAHHKGTYIRLAYADRLEGPWTTYEPGTLKLEDSYCVKHVASPDVHVDDQRRRIRMYYHGPVGVAQMTKVAISQDGIKFTARPENLGISYFRVFRWGGYHYAVAFGGVVYRSKDGLSDFEKGPVVFDASMRHSAVKLDGDRLSVFYSRIGGCPERILLTRVDLSPDWRDWAPSCPVPVLEPTTEYEGAGLPLEPSEVGWAPKPVRQLRDPAIFCEDDRTYLLYSIAGESGIAIAEIMED